MQITAFEIKNFAVWFFLITDIQLCGRAGKWFKNSMVKDFYSKLGFQQIVIDSAENTTWYYEVCTHVKRCETMIINDVDAQLLPAYLASKSATHNNNLKL